MNHAAVKAGLVGSVIDYSVGCVVQSSLGTISRALSAVTTIDHSLLMEKEQRYKDLNLAFKLRLVEMLLKRYQTLANANQFHFAPEEKCMDICIKEIGETVQFIHHNVYIVQIKMNKFERQWFKILWRASLDIVQEVTELERLDCSLTNKIDWFDKILNLIQNLSVKKIV